MPRVLTRPIAPTTPFRCPVVIVCVGSKGGSLKTAGSAALAYTYAERGYATVLGDLDPQGSLSLRSGQPRAADPYEAAPHPLTYTVRGGTYVPAGTVHLYAGGRVMDGATTEEVERHLQRILRGGEAGPPDVVILDTPPALGPITITAMRHASVVIVPSEATREGVDGVHDVVALHRRLGLQTPLRVLLTRVHGSNQELTDWVCEELAELARGDVDVGRVELGERAAPAELLLRARIPYTIAGIRSAVFELPVTATARADASSTAWRRAATEIVGDVLGLQMRSRRVPVRVKQSSGAAAPAGEPAARAMAGSAA